MRFKHSGCIGDLIYTLPVIKYLGGTTLFLEASRSRIIKDRTLKIYSGFDPKIIPALIPLLEHQPYIKQVKVYNKEPYEVNLDEFRDNPDFPGRHQLCEFILNHFNVPLSVSETPWLQADMLPVAKYVFNRTFRYRNDKTIPSLKNLVKKFKEEAVFIGFRHEWLDFCNKVGVSNHELKFYEVRNLYEAASIINACDTFIGNQSAAMAIAIALGKKFIQEVYHEIPDCIFDRKDCKYLKTNISLY